MADRRLIALFGIEIPGPGKQLRHLTAGSLKRIHSKVDFFESVPEQPFDVFARRHSV